MHLILPVALRPNCRDLRLAAALFLLLTGPARAIEIITDPGTAMARLQSRAGAALKLEFDAVMQVTETLLIATNTSVDATGHDVTLDAGGARRHFVITNGATLQLIGLRLMNGRSLGSTDLRPGTAAQGGAILNHGGVLELIDCTLLDNEARGAAGTEGADGAGLQRGMRGGGAFGGAIYAANGQLNLTRCQFNRNTAAGGLGAASANGYTGGGGDAFGGAVYSTNTPAVLESVIFDNNVAQAGEMSAGRPLEGGGSAFGGAFAQEGGTLSANACVFVLNRASGATKVASDQSRQTGLAQGGALFHSHGLGQVAGTLFATNSSIGGLGAERGGQIVFGDGQGGAIASRGDLEIQNSAFISNLADAGDVPPDCCSPLTAQAGNSAGGALMSEGRLHMINSTLATNRAAGGVSTSAGAFSGTAHGGAVAVLAGTNTFLNVTFSGNEVNTSNPRKALGSSVAVVAGQAAFTNSILNSPPGSTNVSGVILDGGHNLCSDSSAQLALPSSHNSVDPLLGPLTASEGLTPIFPLLPASPAIDAGSDLASPATDQRGVARPMGLAADIGAFELAPEIALARSSEGTVTIEYTFRAGQTNDLSASTDLRHWVPLGTAVSNQAGFIRFEDRAAAGMAEKFYRLSVRPLSPKESGNLRE